VSLPCWAYHQNHLIPLSSIFSAVCTDQSTKLAALFLFAALVIGKEVVRTRYFLFD